jgi:hypothetical protein
MLRTPASSIATDAKICRRIMRSNGRFLQLASAHRLFRDADFLG